MNGGGSTVLPVFGSSEDYARLLGGHFPVLKHTYFGVQVKDDANWTTVSQEGFEVYKAFVHKSEDKECPPDWDNPLRSNNEGFLRKLRKMYPRAHYDLVGISVVLEELPSSMILASVSGPMPATFYIAANGLSCGVQAASLISGKIIVQYCSFLPYTSPEDLVTAMDALRAWRNDTLAANNY